MKFDERQTRMLHVLGASWLPMPDKEVVQRVARPPAFTPTSTPPSTPAAFGQVLSTVSVQRVFSIPASLKPVFILSCIQCPANADLQAVSK